MSGIESHLSGSKPSVSWALSQAAKEMAATGIATQATSDEELNKTISRIADAVGQLKR